MIGFSSPSSCSSASLVSGFEEEDEDAGNEKLGEDHQRLRLSQAAQGAAVDVGHGFPYDDDERQHLGGRAEYGPVSGVAHVELDDVAAHEKLEDEPGRHDGADAELHQRPLGRGEDDPQEGELVVLPHSGEPVERGGGHYEVRD